MKQAWIGAFIIDDFHGNITFGITRAYADSQQEAYGIMLEATHKRAGKFALVKITNIFEASKAGDPTISFYNPEANL